MSFEGRKYVIIAAVIFVAMVFILRLFYVQVIDDQWKAEAANISERKITVYPARGLVYDRHGHLLVANTPVYDLMVIPREVEDLDSAAFCRLIGVEMEQLRERLSAAKRYSRHKPTIFEKQIPSTEYAGIAAHLHKFKGFYGQSRTLRDYPDRTAAHTLGYISEVGPRTIEKNPYYKAGDMIGVGGLEYSYEEELRGTRGSRYVVVDVFNNIKGPYKGGDFDTLAIAGRDLYTTIDADLQAYGERLMQNKVGSVVAIEPKTGEVLALVSSPAYDPELLVGRVRSKNYRALQRDSLKPLFNRALQAQYPPGSIFKIVQSLIALQQEVILPTTGFSCNKSLVGCHNHPTAFDVTHSIQYSCNPYYYQVFKRLIEKGQDPSKFKDAHLGLDQWREDMMAFGLGQRLGLDVPSVKKGDIPGSAYYDKVYGEYRWAFSTIYSLSIGQGEVQVIPLQMANLAAIFANKGYYYDPHLVRAVGSPDSTLAHYNIPHQTGVDAHWFDLVQEAMRRVVEEPGGTARRARIKGIQVCGKTGTAENPHGEDHSVFIAFAPKDDPKIAIATYVENAGFGGTWAAPISRLMIEQYLNDSIADPRSEQRILEKDFIHPQP